MVLTFLFVFSYFIALLISKHQATPLVTATIIVEGGDSLVGEHCPGTVRLFCEGINLEYLRWSYSAEMLINDPVIQTSIPSDAVRVPIVLSNNPAFLTVEVVNIISSEAMINGSSYSIANFSTILTADLVQLALQNITSITCGQFVHFTDTIEISVSILRPSFAAPRTLNITNVHATYQSGNLDSLKVQWTMLEPTCSIDAWILFYKVSLNSSTGTVEQRYINSTSCNANGCLTTFVGNFVGPTNEYTISVRADNFVKVYPISIGYQRGQYDYVPEIVTTSCYITIQCKSLPGYAVGGCQILYSTTDPTLNTNVSSINTQALIVPLDTIVRLPYLTPGLAIHYVSLKSNLNKELSVNDIIAVNPMISTVVPDTPENLSILGVYSNRGQLEFMKVTWTKLKCEDIRGSPVNYRISISDSNERTLSTKIGVHECTDTNCSVNIMPVEFTASLSIQLSLEAINMAGSSSYLRKPQIYQASAWYYRPQVTFVNCSVLQVSCVISENVNESSLCTVYYYGADSQFEQILTTEKFSKNETTKILPLEPTRTTVHYLAFQLNISKEFQIKDRFTYSISEITSSCSQVDGSSGNTITIAVGLSLGLFCCLLTVIILVVVAVKCIKRERRNKMNLRTEKKEIQRKSESPVYEEIGERIYLETNGAYVGITHPNN